MKKTEEQRLKEALRYLFRLIRERQGILKALPLETKILLAVGRRRYDMR
jgi:hypothetical protein